MRNIFSDIRSMACLFLIVFLGGFGLAGCSSGSGGKEVPADTPPRDSSPQVLSTECAGTVVYESEIVSFDLSNAAKGYMHLTYKGTNEKVKFQVAAPDGVTYTYLVTDCKEPTVFPLTGGNGAYTFTLYESVDAANDKYAVSFTQGEEVTLDDEFSPYLTPNVYTHYAEGSQVVSKSVELAGECYGDLDVISNVYHYVTENVTYDTEKAQTVPYGYIPDPDETLASGTGICFDYASLMTVLLRVQRIPTRLEVGYAGEVYHAWISCYVEEIGWVDNIIEFDGKSWSLMDPTLAANNDSSSVKEYIGDGSKYLVKYTY